VAATTTVPSASAELWNLLPQRGDDPLGLGVGDGTDRAQRTRFGMRLAAQRDRIVAGDRIEAAGRARAPSTGASDESQGRPAPALGQRSERVNVVNLLYTSEEIEGVESAGRRART